MPEMGLKGSVAIVTGAGALDDGIGNGRAASILLAREGTHVALLDLERAAAERTHAMIESEGGSSAVLACDVTDPKACERAVGDVVARWGGLDVLVNNVGWAARAARRSRSISQRGSLVCVSTSRR
jgi:NAD(P)-dependent dehydrogenase (short-subunit alcohol dehydrogenase family)